MKSFQNRIYYYIITIFHHLEDGGFPLSRMTSNLITKSVLWNFATIQILPFLNNPKDLDPSYKMDLNFWDWERKKSVL